MPCPDPSSLKAIAAGLLPVAETRALQEHLDVCADCRSAVIALARSTVSTKRSEIAVPGSIKAGAVPDLANCIAGRFQIERFAGAGGMGTVFRAIDLESKLPVALKLLSTTGTDTDRFDREAEVLARLDHPCIVRHVAHGRAEDGTPFLAMEWLEGEDLASRLSRGPVGIPEALVLLQRIAAALAYAHERRVVHRDVKPQNIVLPKGALEQAKLVDFGIVRLLGATRPATATGSVLGTLGYMAPEQARGERTVDARADVFALGCVLFELLSGRPAFAGQHVVAILAKILLDDPPRVEDVVPHVPRWISELVQAMLRKSPEDRLRDGAAVLLTLQHHTTSRPQASSPRPTTAAALSIGEQRLVCVTLVGSPRSEEVDTAPTLSSEAEEARTTQLRAEVAPYGSRLEVLGDGSCIIVTEGKGHATDLARAAARCALAVRAQRPLCPISLTTGRAEIAGPIPIGEAIDRAATLVRRPLRSTDGGDSVGGIAIDDTTAGLLDAAFELRSEGADLVLVGEHSELAVVRTLLGKATPFVGREKELGLMLGVFEECVAEPGARALLVVAPAGTGKSRLRYEFLRKPQIAGARAELLLGRGEAITVSAPFTILGGALRHNAGLVEAEPVEARRRKLRARVGRNLPPQEVVRVGELLGQMVGIHTPDPESPELRAALASPERMRLELRRAWVDFLKAEADAYPVVLVVEDLHWAQATTIELIEAALDATRDKPFLVLALARLEVDAAFPDLWSEHALVRVDLSPLSRKASERLVRQTLGADADAPTIDALVSRSAGNPLHLEELIRAAGEGRADSTPGAILAMIQSRLETLPQDCRRILRLGSVFGGVFWRSAVELLGGEAPPGALDAALAELARRELISPQSRARFPGDSEYAFRHDLVAEAAYQSLTDADRRLGHGLAGEWLESAGEDNPLVIAEHLIRCAEPQRILSWLDRWARRVRLLRVAPLLTEARERVLPAVDERGTIDDRVVARSLFARMLCSSHNFAESQALLAEAETICGTEGPVCEVQLAHAEVAMFLGDFAASKDWCDRIVDPAKLRGLGRFLLELCQGQVCGAALGQPCNALEHLDAARQLLLPGDVGLEVELEKSHALVSYFCGDFARSIEAGERHAQLARAAGLDYQLALATHNVADSLLCLGDPDRAEKAMSESAEIAERNQFRRLLAHNKMYLAYLRAGDRVDAATAELRAGISEAESSGYSWDGLNGRLLLSRLMAEQRPEDARAVVSDTIDRAQRLKNHLVEAEARKLLTDL